MRSKPTTSAKTARESDNTSTTRKRVTLSERQGASRRFVPHPASAVSAVPVACSRILLLAFAIVISTGCVDPVPQGPELPLATPADPDTESPVQQPKRLARGEMPEEWIEPQRERIFAVDTSSKNLDLTFDDLKFDIEVGEPFERELLSEDVKALDGKEITLSGYMRPSFKASGLKGFIFVRDNKECCFGPQAAIYDCVRVKLEKGKSSDYKVRPFKVRGTFYLKEREGPDGGIWSIFNMKNATIES